MALQIHHFIVPPLANNAYLVWDDQTGKAILIDPAMGAEKIIDYSWPRKLAILYIVNTHGHYDHVWENAKLKKTTRARLCIGKGDEKLLADAGRQMPAHLRLPYDVCKPDRLLKEGDAITFGGESLAVLHTPGHTPGSICLYYEKTKILFTGDTLFAGTYGRTDLPNSDSKAMEKSIARLARMPKETTVFPGHGMVTTLSKENWLHNRKL